MTEYCYSCLSDDLSEAEALSIVKEELSKIPATTLAQVAITGNLEPISLAIKESVKRICIEGAKKKLNTKDVYLWVAGAVAGLLLLWFIFK
jgi:hypothetical protein